MSKQIFPKFKAAAVQSCSVFRDAPDWIDVDATLEKAIKFIEEAAKNGARLVVFPECFLPAYPYWSLDFEDIDNFEKIWACLLRNSVEVPGPETEVLCNTAKQTGTYIVMGINERDKVFPGRMYNSVLYIGPQGNIMGNHRKICNTVQERYFHTPGGGGDNLRTVFNTELGKIGGSICGEHTQSLLTYGWIMQGIQVHCSLWPGQFKLETLYDVQSRAFCWTAHSYGILASAYLPDADIPKNFYRNSLFTIRGGFKGGSGIVNPKGEYLAGPVYDKETIVYGDIDLSVIDREHFAISLTGIYSRWDILNVNAREEPHLPNIPTSSDGRVVQDERYAILEQRVQQLEQELAESRKRVSSKKSNAD